MITDYMTRKLITTREDVPILEVLKVMTENRLSGIPVITDEDKLVGFAPNTRIMETILPDFLRSLPASVAGVYGADLNNYLQDKKDELLRLQVKDIMVKPSHILYEDSTFIEAAKVFVEKGINRIAVLDKEEKLIGIVCRNNVLNALYDSLSV